MLNDMKKTADHYRLHTLASNQVGLEANACILKTGENWKTLLNPKIIAISEATKESYEMCPSFPLLKFKIKRHDDIKV